MWSHSNWEEENKMDAHAELQNSVAQTRSCDVCLQVRGGKGFYRSFEKFPVEA